MDALVRPADPADWIQLEQFPSAVSFRSHEFLIAAVDASIVAFLAWRRIALDEAEILHLETLASFRRRGLARRLLQNVKQHCLHLFLEVRRTNFPALQLYHSEGFTEIGTRKNYYSGPPEEAIVLKFHS